MEYLATTEENNYTVNRSNILATSAENTGTKRCWSYISTIEHRVGTYCGVVVHGTARNTYGNADKIT
eukprot:scaffold86659_cov40-Cyclotella_meneghiniana.AAC.1